MTDQQLTNLVNRQLDGSITDLEKAALVAYAGNPDNRAKLADLLVAHMEQSTERIEEGNPDWRNRARQIVNLEREFVKNRPSLLINLRKWTRVAALLILLAGTGYFFFNRLSLPRNNHLVYTPPPIEAGRDGAILTLADGSLLMLDSLEDGAVGSQQGVALLLENGQLAYKGKGDTAGEMKYNMITTPKGRQFQVVLPDGTRVWLNAASSLRYPTTFSGNERKVEMSGEAYFEVAANARLPFRVSTYKQVDIEVLGTHFNVNAYENEAVMSATLLEGRIKVVAGRPESSNPSLMQATLKPGQQAQVNNSSPQTQVSGLKVTDNVAIDQVMAWKNGQFNFEGLTLPQVMRQLERWYNITVQYERGGRDIQFGGSVSRKIPLAQLLKELEYMGIHFRMEGERELILLP